MLFIVNQLFVVSGIPNVISKTKGKLQFADRSMNSTNSNPEIGRLRAVANAHRNAQNTTILIGKIKTKKATIISNIPI